MKNTTYTFKIEVHFNNSKKKRRPRRHRTIRKRYH